MARKQLVVIYTFLILLWAMYFLYFKILFPPRKRGFIQYLYANEYTKDQQISTYLQQNHNLTVITDRDNLQNADIVYMYSVDHNELDDGQLALCIANYSQIDDKSNLDQNLKKFDQQLEHGIDTKLKLFQNKEDYEKFREQSFNSKQFMPQSYSIDLNEFEISSEERKILQIKNNINNNEEENQQEQQTWILKPTNANSGQGIILLYSLQELQFFIRNKEYISEHEEIESPKIQNQETFEILRKMQKEKTKFIVQDYIPNPMLINKRKFDLRVYIYVLSTEPFIALYSNGYIRKTLVDYDLKDESKFGHLVNHNVQKYHPNYEKQKETTHWTNQQWEDYMINHQHYTKKQIQNIYNEIKAILTYTLMAGIENGIPLKKGGTQLFGADIMLDENDNIYLIEINKNPYIKLTTQAHQKVIPQVLKNWLDTSLLIQKNRHLSDFMRRLKKNKFVCQIFPSEDCQILINQASKYNYLQDFFNFGGKQNTQQQQGNDISEDLLQEFIFQQEDL